MLAYALPVVVAAWGVRLFSGKPSPRYLRLTATALVLGLAAVVLIGLAAGPGAESIDWGAGRLGGLCARSLATGLGLAGSYVVTVVALLVFLIFFTGISIRPLVGVVAAAALAGVSAVSWLARKAAGLIKPRGPKRRKKPVAVSEAEDHPGPAGPEEIPEVEEDEPEEPAGEAQEEFSFDLGGGPEKPAEEEPAAAVSEERQQKMTDDLSAGLRRGIQPAGAGPGYELPSFELLDPLEEQKKVVSDEELVRMGKVLMAKLADFSVEGELVNFTRGPQVSTFEIKPAPGVKINRIAALADDLAMAMHAKRVRILAPIPGKGAVGVGGC